MNRSIAVMISIGSLTPALMAGDCNPQWDQSIGQPGMFGQTGPFVGGTVLTLEVFDSGEAEYLYAGGTFTMAGGQSAQHIARWNGSEWSALEGGGLTDSPSFGVPAAYSLLSHNDGSGAALFVGGAFEKAGGVTVNGIAKYDGQQWSPLSTGMAGLSIVVRDLAVFEGDLIAGGSFDTAGGQTVNRVARWDGKQWHSLGNGLSGNVSALAVFDDGTGPALYAGGVFTGYYDEANNVVSSPYIAKWDGESWSPVGTVNLNSHVFALAVFDDGEGPALYAGGLFVWAGSQWAPNIAKWDGTQWASVGGGFNDSVRVLKVLDDSTGPTLYAGGEMTLADEFNDTGNGTVQVNHIARWDGGHWAGLESGANDDVLSLIPFDSEDGPQVIMGGRFTAINGVEANHIAVWQGCADDAVPGDLNNDGVVDVLDLLILLSAWGKCGDPSNCPADLNQDGSVDVLDLLILLSNWG